MASTTMRVIKRNGASEEIMFDKIQTRLKNLLNNATTDICYQKLSMKVIEQLHDNITTTQIDELAAEQCAAMSSQHPDYGLLASKLVVSSHQKNTEPLFSNVSAELFSLNLVTEDYYNFTVRFAEELNATINYERDYLFDYFGFKTLERAYLFKNRKTQKIIERPQHMWMRVAVGIHGRNDDPSALDLVKETYEMMSLKYFTHATPTLFNAGTPCPQLSSCFLLALEDDSIVGIYDTLKDCAMISKYSGGIGLHIHNIRSKGSYIKGTNGTTDGLVPMLRVYNATSRYVNQGGKRNGSFAVYLEPWHPDVFDFLELRKNHGDEELKARDLFFALWVPDLFMERVKQPGGKWSFFCPNTCPRLSDTYGDEFRELYEKYEEEGLAKRTINARDLWFAILDAQMETGTPYLVYKDSVNKKSNQKNVGIIKSSNLCTEITEYSDANETAVCNLASVALPAFVNADTKEFDYSGLEKTVKIIVNNLNRVIDINYYPTEKTKTSNFRHRPIGIGVQGLADTFMLMDIPFHSDAAKQINKLIFETLYYSALSKSNEIAMHYGTYSSYDRSPASQGLLQFDLWNMTMTDDRHDWTGLKKSIADHGLRNSLLVALMPTASTSQILGFNECFEPFTSNLYTRRTLAGEFVMVNQHLIKELMNLGKWNEQIKDNIVANKGSIQQLTFLPEHVRNKYKISWEIPMKHIIDMSADRAPFVCQSQSLNLWMEDPTYGKLTSMHFYAWEKGLKTGIYYLRRKAKHQAQQFTIEPTLITSNEMSYEDDAICEMCSA